jgi:glucan phosphoethanolaminetransferase (alkaline phosphatase superfamily)
MWLHALDILYWWAHVLVISFNLLGWIWIKTRKLHLISVGLTLVEGWLILGIWYGLGYCFLTDWHWQVKRQLGQMNLPNSFITFLLNDQLGFQLSPSIVDLWTGILFSVVVLISLYLNRGIIVNTLKK